MIKRVATSIIAVAVLMGGLVACGGTTQVVTPTPEPEPIVEETPEEGHDGHDAAGSEFNFELLTEHPFDCLNQELDVFVNVFGIYVISHSSIPTEDRKSVV